MKTNELEEFIKALRESSKIKSSLIYHKEDKYKKTKCYIDDKEYYNKIYHEMKERKISSFELNKDKRNGLAPIMSLASSGRLCYLDFRNKGEVSFEVPIMNDRDATTKMDAVIGNTFYECKCQEVITKEKEKLNKSYINSKLFKEFNIGNIKCITYKDKNGNDKKNRKGELEQYLDFSLRDLGIDLDGKYYDLRINIKQLICHLIAIANNKNDKEPKILQYIIYIPNKDLIKKTNVLTNIYNEIDKEKQAIFNSEKIKKFLKNHNIELKDFIMEHNIESKDSIYKEISNIEELD